MEAFDERSTKHTPCIDGAECHLQQEAGSGDPPAISLCHRVAPKANLSEVIGKECPSHYLPQPRISQTKELPSAAETIAFAFTAVSQSVKTEAKELFVVFPQGKTTPREPQQSTVIAKPP
jgi:hypothetical protein